jgi:hypothetical protein
VQLYLDGKPCIAIAGYGKGSGVYVHHAVTLDQLRSLPYKESVYCLCVDTARAEVFFGTQLGKIC